MRNDAGYVRSMGITGTALTGRPCHVRQMDIYGQVAYHMRQGKEDIVAIDFQYDFKRPEEETSALLYGLFTHEIMHAIRTDSSYKEKRLNEFPAYERSIRRDIWNIIEDPAIEYFARWEVSPTLFQCLQKTIRYFYDEAPDIQDSGSDAWLQFVAALIMFGDVGALKGKFTFPEAFDCFKKSAPIMLKAIEEADAQKRFELSQEIVEIARPLWEEHYEKNVDANTSTHEILSELGVSESKGTGEPVSNEEYGSDVDDDTMQRRKRMVSILDESGREDGTENGSETEAENDEAVEDSADTSGCGSGSSENSDESSDEIDGSGSASDGSDAASSKDADFDNSASDSQCNSDLQDRLNAINEKLKELSDQVSADSDPEEERALQDALKHFLDQHNREKHDGQQQKRRSLVIDDLHLEVRSPYYKNSSMEVVQMTTGYEKAYDELCKQERSSIVNFRAQLKKVLQGKYSKKEYATVGKVSVDRMCGRKLTARVFEKRRMPDDKSDMAIVIMVDQSYSMNHSISAVMEVCTILMEAFSHFDIPIKLVGFASDRYKDATYYHYGNWSNDRSIRMMIPGISADGGTFLGHAIRYGGELLKRRPERHKLFIVLTDAEPCYNVYKSNDDAYSDCRYAVQDISKFANVLGLGIYDSRNDMEEKAFRFIFGKDGLSVNEPSAIVKDLPKMIGRFLKS